MLAAHPLKGFDFGALVGLGPFVGFGPLVGRGFLLGFGALVGRGFRASAWKSHVLPSPKLSVHISSYLQQPYVHDTQVSVHSFSSSPVFLCHSNSSKYLSSG